jgi:hypothetical protein
MGFRIGRWISKGQHGHEQKQRKVQIFIAFLLLYSMSGPQRFSPRTAAEIMSHGEAERVAGLKSWV